MKIPRTIILIALVALSAIFFIPAIAPLADSLLRDAGVSPGVSGAVSSVLWNYSWAGMVSLCGGIVLLLATRDEDPSWFLGIPLAATCAIITLSPYLQGLFVIHDPSPPLYHPGVICSLLAGYGTFLLPPCAALFFWSQRRLGRGVTVMTGISLIITLNSLIFTYYLFSPYLVAAGLLPPAQPLVVDGQPVKMADGEGILFLILHYMIGLPVIGLCILALAALSWNATRKSGSDHPRSPGTQ